MYGLGLGSQPASPPIASQTVPSPACSMKQPPEGYAHVEGSLKAVGYVPTEGAVGHHAALERVNAFETVVMRNLCCDRGDERRAA